MALPAHRSTTAVPSDHFRKLNSTSERSLYGQTRIRSAESMMMARVTILNTINTIARRRLVTIALRLRLSSSGPFDWPDASGCARAQIAGYFIDSAHFLRNDCRCSYLNVLYRW